MIDYRVDPSSVPTVVMCTRVIIDHGKARKLPCRVRPPQPLPIGLAQTIAWSSSGMRRCATGSLTKRYGARKEG